MKRSSHLSVSNLSLLESAKFNSISAYAYIMLLLIILVKNVEWCHPKPRICSLCSKYMDNGVGGWGGYTTYKTVIGSQSHVRPSLILFFYSVSQSLQNPGPLVLPREQLIRGLHLHPYSVRNHRADYYDTFGGRRSGKNYWRRARALDVKTFGMAPLNIRIIVDLTWLDLTWQW